MFTEKEVSRETVYQGRIVNVRSDVVELINGKHAPREVIEHPGGVCIVPVDADRNCYLVRQFRHPVGKDLLEFPAGKLDPGEDPMECAIRELGEETGLSAKEVVSLGVMYPSPGYSDEVLHLFLAQDLTEGTAHPDENEFLSIEKIPLTTLADLVASNQVPDAKTVFALFRTMQYIVD